MQTIDSNIRSKIFVRGGCGLHPELLPRFRMQGIVSILNSIHEVAVAYDNQLKVETPLSSSQPML